MRSMGKGDTRTFSTGYGYIVGHTVDDRTYDTVHLDPGRGRLPGVV